MSEGEKFKVVRRTGKTISEPREASVSRERLKAVRAKIRALGLTEKVVDQAIRWARGRQGDE